MKLIPHFQSIRDVYQNRTIIGYEATIRGSRGLSAEELFIQAYESNRVVELDCEARKVAIRQGIKLLKPGQRLFVNIAPQTINSNRRWFPRSAPLEKLVLEVTERSQIKDLVKTKHEADTLRKNGLQVALDDFGKGFNNFNTITELRPELIKIDLSLIQRIHQPSVKDVIKQWAIFCNSLDIKLIAEGVETEQQVNALLNLNVRYHQGFYFDYPKPANYWIKNSLTPSI